LARESDYGVNDFGLKIATVNGTGSASANGLLLQALFRMGIPVSGKNVFPSNIQGLPTWYEIRVNKDGYTARSPDFQLGVAMNPESYARDIEEVVSGGWILYDNSRELDDEFRRDDVTFLGIPLADMCVEHFQGSRIRILMKNITYVGALVALLDIDMDVVKGMLQEKFASKQHLMDANYTAIELGHTYALEHFDCPLPIRLEAMDKTKDCVMVTGMRLPRSDAFMLVQLWVHGIRSHLPLLSWTASQSIAAASGLIQTQVRTTSASSKQRMNSQLLGW